MDPWEKVFYTVVNLAIAVILVTAGKLLLETFQWTP